ncbi:MAG: Lrp/AsnC family transcriptional regulator [Gammaproteobacteria bacterium]|nr:Lrp/AsnC family transcriptional regulator [Gammaproteobacteria bacterium]MBU1655899.1 Lrp/AsnC family transcriptional regulator [Gammaproteobacteria bacterium]MBU1961004.1 Lrp/AsnC family transcriptional regulator [Gammaproteobacteria bacterium]
MSAFITALERAFINRFQGNVPLVARPYEIMGAELGLSEAELLEMIRRLLESGILTRFGPSYDASRIKGELSLAAMAVPEDRFEEVTLKVNALPAVAHNYRRDHALNMWFVISTLAGGGVAHCIDDIESATGLRVLDFPKQREFYLGLLLHLGEDGQIETIPAPDLPLKPAIRPVDLNDEISRAIIKATEEGLPLVEAPFECIGRPLGLSSREVIDLMEGMLASGGIRRIGAFPNHYKLGLRGNGMTVWDVPDEVLEEAGQAIGALDFVSHCYERPRHPGIWPYNLFAMAHGRDRDEVRAKGRCVAELLGDRCRGQDTLFSTAILKKTGLRT